MFAHTVKIGKRWGFGISFFVFSLAVVLAGDVISWLFSAPFRIGLPFLLCTFFVVAADFPELARRSVLASVAAVSAESLAAASLGSSSVGSPVASAAAFAVVLCATHLVFVPVVRHFQTKYPGGARYGKMTVRPPGKS